MSFWNQETVPRRPLTLILHISTTVKTSYESVYECRSRFEVFFEAEQPGVIVTGAHSGVKESSRLL